MGNSQKSQSFTLTNNETGKALNYLYSKVQQARLLLTSALFMLALNISRLIQAMG